MKNIVYQDKFLRHLANKQMLVCVFLVGGIKLQGYVKDFDEHVVVIQGKNAKEEQLIFKQVISTIMLASQLNKIKQF